MTIRSLDRKERSRLCSFYAFSFKMEISIYFCWQVSGAKPVIHMLADSETCNANGEGTVKDDQSILMRFKM